MRMRKKKNGAARIEACGDLLIRDPEKLSTEPQYDFPVKRPLHLEIGCGKGNFACGMAAAHPDVNFIAMEKVPDVACLALEKAKKSAIDRPDNLRFLIGDAKNLAEWFPRGSVDCLYLNFSDPWPKSGHAKRRLTYHTFLALYRDLLVPDGILRFKTDNEVLFDFSLEEFAAFGLEIVWQTRDLHASEYAAGNVMTEYEANFSSQGKPILAAMIRFPKREEPEMIYDLMKKERSYRSFDSSFVVSRETLCSFVEAARLAPSSINIQPLKYRLVYDTEECAKVLPLTGWAKALTGIQLPPEGHAPTAYIVICSDERISDRDIFTRDVGIVAQTIMLSAVEMGLGGCMIGSFRAQSLSEVLAIPEGVTPRLVLALGKPDEEIILEDAVDGNVAYYRDAIGVHHVPKRSLDDLIL